MPNSRPYPYLTSQMMILKKKKKSITSELADGALLQIKVDYGETKAFIVPSREPTQEAL